MTYNRSHARALLDTSELKVFEQSVGDALTGWTPVQLRQRLKRAGALRDKYRDLLRRQKLATRARTGTKLGASGDANARTEQKVKLFEEVLQRLKAQQGKLTAANAREAQRASAGVVASGRRPPGQPPVPSSSKGKAVGVGTKSKTTGAFAGPNASKAAQQAQLAATRAKVIQTHLASRGRRQQAARDKR